MHFFCNYLIFSEIKNAFFKALFTKIYYTAQNNCFCAFIRTHLYINNERARAHDWKGKNEKKCKKNAEKFAYVKKKQYFCARFR